MRRRLGWSASVLILAIVSAGAGWWAGRQSMSPQEAAAQAAPPEPSLVTAPVERKTLTSQLVARGTAEPAGRTEVSVPWVAGDVVPVLTAILVEVGSELSNTQVIAEVAERPVFIFEGALPAFRPLTLGARGDDVAQLEAALVASGHDLTADDVLDGDTVEAVVTLYEEAGYDLPAARNSTGLDAVLPLSEFVFVEGLPRVVEAVLVERGQRVDGPLLRVATTELEIATSIAALDRSLVTRGADAEIHLDDLGLIVPATVTTVGDRPMEGSSDYEIVVTPTTDAPPEALAGSVARIVIPIESTTGEVLVVPVAALSSGPDGGARIEVDDGDGTSRLVPVLTGLTAGGEVEVRPTDNGELEEGDRVVVG